MRRKVESNRGARYNYNVFGESQQQQSIRPITRTWKTERKKIGVNFLHMVQVHLYAIEWTCEIVNDMWAYERTLVDRETSSCAFVVSTLQSLFRIDQLFHSNKVV